jgi:hypothetical protein
VQQFNAKAAGRLNDLLLLVGTIAREGRAAGMHLLIVDQRPTEWEPSIAANVSAVFTFRMPRGKGEAAGYYYAHELPPYHFAFEDEIYRPLHIKPEAIAPGLARSRPSTPPPLIPAELRAGRPIVAPADTANFGDAFEDDPTTDKQAAAFAWMDKHRPNGGTQADMRRAINLSKGYASELWAKWTPLANGAPPPTSSSASPPEPASTAATDAFGRPHHTIHADDPASAETLAAIRAAIESGAATINRRK